MKRRAKGKKPTFRNDQTIRLQNPVSSHFPAFIFGNATKCDAVVERREALGKHLIICGAGPTLRDHLDLLESADQVWGCNSALTYLYDNGHKVTHGFTVDQTPHMCAEWASMPDVEYLIASSVHPNLTEMLEANGKRFRFFHNFVGIQERPVAYAVCPDCDGTLDANVKACPTCGRTMLLRGMMDYETWMYSALYPGTVRAGSGLNATTRAIDVALYMGFRKITLLGADCALRLKEQAPNAPVGSPEHMAWLRNSVEMHADGGHALASEATPVTMGGVIDGRHWETKPDMIISAVWLVRMHRALKGRLEIVGDTLPNALIDKSDEYLDTLPHLTDSDGKPMQFCYPYAEEFASDVQEAA